MYRKSIYSLVLIALSGAILVLGACNGSKTNGGGGSGSGSQFVATDSSVGTIVLTVSSTSLGIGDTSSFSVLVKDVNGQPVPQTNISCDTEVGLAIIEPTKGFELTDSFGNMSGVVGCEVPGSLQIACRLPVGANKRKFETIHCTGQAPSGFTGFPGAAGGGLGGGVDTSNDSSGDLRITLVSFFDAGDTTTDSPSIDTVAGTCVDASAEPFFDTIVGLKVQNNSAEIVRLTGYKYTVANFDGTGASHKSPTINFTGEAPTLDSNGGTVTVYALFADAESGGKRFFGRTDLITDEGFKNITFTVLGETVSGDSISITTKAAASFDNFNRCAD